MKLPQIVFVIVMGFACLATYATSETMHVAGTQLMVQK